MFAKFSAGQGDRQIIAEHALPDSEELRSFIVQLASRSELPFASFLQEYWLETGHIERLLYLFHRVTPLLKSTDHLLDIGSFGEWPLLLWKYLGLSHLYGCSLEGNYLAYGHGSLKQPHELGKEFELTINQIDVENQPLPFEDKSIDVITCFEVLEHFRYDPVFAMKEFNRVLKDDALLILTTPNVNSYEGLLRMIQYNTPCIFSRYHPREDFHRGIGHSKEYSVTEVRQLLKNCGFKVNLLETFDSLPPQMLSPESIAKYRDLKPFLEARGWSEEFARQGMFVVARRVSKVVYRYFYPLYTITEECE